MKFNNKENSNKKSHLLSFKRKYLCIPYSVFLILFIIVPVIIIVCYSFTDSNGWFSFQSFIDFFTTWSKINCLIVSVFIKLSPIETPAFL